MITIFCTDTLGATQALDESFLSASACPSTSASIGYSSLRNLELIDDDTPVIYSSMPCLQGLPVALFRDPEVNLSPGIVGFPVSRNQSFLETKVQ